ncbi:hypothetical protein [Cellulomonas cellasea]|uniref:Lipoprotein n=1 Tax=Cellulomonas cellasea TaxID=43670 RepID=A0A7W4UIP4_9CELL|nr:hypothetical protein [Cellulomonas cellasea]MBB2924898.1 hypothetical protein [Cellulomonas cellasea]
MRTLPAAVSRSVTALLCAVCLAACGSGGGGAADAGPSPDGATDGIDALRTESPAPDGSAAPGDAATEAAGEDGSCAGAAEAVEAAVAGVETVTGVEVVGQCTTVILVTALAADGDGVVAATAVCEQAGPEAYGHDLGAVSVTAADGTELAIGVDGAPCLGAY